MKKTNKIITIFMLITVLTMSLFISNVGASVTIANDAQDRTVTITRNVTGVTNPVTNTFTYTIAPDTQYNPGTVTGYPTSTTVAFSGVTPNASGTATQTGAVDFGGTTFPTVGDYRFILTETGSTNTTQYPLDNTTYYLYVSVRYAAGDTDGTSMEATVVSSAMTSTAAPTSQTKEAVVFTSGAELTHVTISKTVTGNMGDKSKYFDISVNIPGTGTYLVSGGKYGTPANSSTTVTAGTATTLQIKHGETITIGLAADGTTDQIPIGINYTVGETAVTGYTTTIDGAATNPKTETTVATAANNTTAIVNNYELATLTGVFINMVPYLLIAAVVLVLIVLLKRSSKKSRR